MNFGQVVQGWLVDWKVPGICRSLYRERWELKILRKNMWWMRLDKYWSPAGTAQGWTNWVRDIKMTKQSYELVPLPNQLDKDQSSTSAYRGSWFVWQCIPSFMHYINQYELQVLFSLNTTKKYSFQSHPHIIMIFKKNLENELDSYAWSYNKAMIPCKYWYAMTINTSYIHMYIYMYVFLIKELFVFFYF